jgi:NADP-dependent 3-hydroxy acid dehydrogenase YdfG
MLTPLPEQTEEAYDQIMDINVKGVRLSLKHEIPAMLKTGGGAIVNNWRLRRECIATLQLRLK